MTIEQAREILKENGFFTDNLWHIDDVKNVHECTDDEAYDILHDVLTSDYIMEKINEAIADYEL